MSTQEPAEPNDSPAAQSASVPSDLACPADGSRDANGRLYDVGVQDANKGRYVAKGAGAKLQLPASVEYAGDLVVCGAEAVLVIAGQFTGRALVSGSGARVIYVDHDPAKPQGQEGGQIFLEGAETQTLSCYETKVIQGQPPCSSLF